LTICHSRPNGPAPLSNFDPVDTGPKRKLRHLAKIPSFFSRTSPLLSEDRWDKRALAKQIAEVSTILLIQHSPHRSYFLLQPALSPCADDKLIMLWGIEKPCTAGGLKTTHSLMADFDYALRFEGPFDKIRDVLNAGIDKLGHVLGVDSNRRIDSPVARHRK
jgi:hypothetical protein